VFEAQVFDPAKWSPSLQNPAFDQADALDEYWAASIIARFTPDQLAALVRSVGYTERGAAEWILRVLSERQFKILEYAFSRVLPLEDPRVEERTILAMTDLAVFAGLSQPYERSYRYRVVHAGEELASGTADLPRLDLSQAAAMIGRTSDPFLTVEWTLAQGSPATQVHLFVHESGILPVGMTRLF
jgi:hypothetical protein